MNRLNNYRITIRVTNEAGALARISILLRKFNVNILSLDADAINPEKSMHDIHLNLETSKNNFPVVVEKLKRLIPVISVSI